MEMRKLHNIVLLLATTLILFAISCEREDLRPRIQTSIPGFENVEAEDNCIILRLDPSFVRPKTKASATERGLDSLNENRINSIDCFFYRTGETDSAPIFKAIGRTVEDEAAIDSTECYVKVYYNDEIAEVLFGSTSSGTCEAFVIANAAINYDPNHCTVNDLRQSVLEYDFSQQEIQPYFTMCSQETAQVTLYSVMGNVNGQQKLISTAAGRVPLYRCASKIQLYLKLPETFCDGIDPCVYAPCPEQLGGIKVQLKSGSKKTYADAEYSLADADYITYSDRTMYKVRDIALVAGKEEYNYGHRPFYSYPMKWTDLDDHAANFIFSIPWKMVKDANGDDVVDGPAERRYYKLSSNVIGRKFEANGFYRTFVYIQSRGDEELDKAEEIDQCNYIITDWVHEGIATGSGSESISGNFIRYNFLVVEPDEVTLNNQATYTFKFKSSSDFEDYKVIIDSVCFYKYTTGVGVRQQRTVNDSQTTVAQRTSGNAAFIDKNEYSVTYNYSKGEIYFTHELDEVYEQRDIYLTVTNEDEISQRVKIHQKPAIMLELHSAGDVFVNGYFGRVKNAGFSSQYAYVAHTSTNWMGQTTTTYQNERTDYWHCSTNYTGRQQVQSGWQTYYNYNVLDSGYGSVLVTTDNMNTSISTNFFTTEINLSAFNSSNHTYLSNGQSVEYRIGDPRVKASANTTDGGYGSGWSLNGYLYWNGSQERTQAWTNPGDILICSMREKDRSLISPRFLISSALNANTGLTWEQVVKRGATYQEAGYPAGRWRLPSEAEIAFIVARQRDGVIPNLYATNTFYWAGSGRLVYVPADANASISFYTTTEAASQTSDTTFSCRFVYDLWYWGDTPSTSNEYHANGHIN
ncbi:MAG: hypothetical protein IJL22_06950 [Bacteroidales bacterium]|nr:hypothetical protein [Bacteroidales bacterium]